MGEYTSRISGFYDLPVEARIETLSENEALDPPSLAWLKQGGGLELSIADHMSENVIAIHGMPFSLALNFRINGMDHRIPMVTEEPSVVAGASNAARMVRGSGGFVGEADASVMTAQVQFDGVPEAGLAALRVAERSAEIMALGDLSIPKMIERGGGCRDLELRVLDEATGMVVVHVYVDVGDAMGANMVDTVAEAVAPCLHEILGGELGLRILSNLPARRLVRVRCTVGQDCVGGPLIADGIARASRFAELDPYRAVTHNKGFMNGVDAVAVALGQDFRSLEAGAHAWAALRGSYRPLSVWKRSATGLTGSAELPMAVGTVGGSTTAHPGVRAAFNILRVSSARELAVVMASAGLASNLAALRALAGEGIQKGHMRLHHRKTMICSEDLASPERSELRP